MPTLELKTAGRQFRRQFGAAIRQNLIRALAELITNSDDSYRRMQHQGGPGFGRIVVLYDRQNRRIAVVDWAEGMDAAAMERMYPSYGAATSGLYGGLSVRGYFGKGIKDVLFSMDGGVVQSIVDGRIYTAHFTWEEDRPIIVIDEKPKEATEAMRRMLGIPEGNGTRVSFTIPEDMSLPRHESLLKNLANFYMLRLINADEQRDISLRTRSARGREQENQVQYQFPTGEPVLADHFQVFYQERVYPVDLEINRAASALTQVGEDREGGILIYESGNTVLDLTLFGYDRDEYAAHLYGMMAVHRFRELLETDESVLTDTRDGLDRHHPFTQALMAEVEARLQPAIEHERHLLLQSAPHDLSRRQSKRLWESIDQINALVGSLTGLDLDLDEAIESLETPPEGGIEFLPRSLQLCRGAKTAVHLRIDTSVISPNTTVELSSDNRRIAVEPRTFEVPIAHGKLVAVQNVVLNGRHVGDSGRIEARAGDFHAVLHVEVVPDRYPQPEGGLAFVPDVLRLANNARRKAVLYVDRSVAKPGNTVHFRVDQPQVELEFEELRLEPGDFKLDVARVELPIKGTGIGRKALVTASANGEEAHLAIEVVSRQDHRPRGPRLLTGYRFDPVTPSRVRSSYDNETGLIWIYLKNPVVERYFGGLPLHVALSTPHCQILLADIILEQIAWVSRRKMIESGAAMYLGSNHTEEDLAAVQRFMAEYGGKIHSWIADQEVIERVVQALTE